MQHAWAILAGLGAVLATLPAPSNAMGETGTEGMLAADRGEGARWVAFHVRTDEPRSAYGVLQALGVRGAVAAGYAVYGTDGALAAQGLFTLDRGWRHGARVEVRADGAEASYGSVAADTALRNVQVTAGAAGLPEFRLLLWVAAKEQAGWSWRAGSNGTSELLGLTQGASTFFYDARDFAGPAAAQAYLQGTGARAQTLTTLERTFEGNLHGLFADGRRGATALNVVSPDGQARSCPCTWSALDETTAPGTYSFGATGAGLHIPGLASEAVVLAGADVRLP